MAWETRRNGRCYYYRSKRVEGRVVKEYLGCAAWVEAAAWLDARDRETDKNERHERNAERDRVDALDGTVAAFYEQTEAALVAVLTAANYHRHDRGGWRKKRNGSSSRKAEEGSRRHQAGIDS